MVHKFEAYSRRRDDKTEAILTAAMALHARDGLEALTLQRLAKELGLVTTALYRYFDSKDALLAALQQRAITTIHAQYRQELLRWEAACKRLSDDRKSLAMIVASARFYTELPTEMPETYQMMAILLSDPKPLVRDDDAAQSIPLVAALVSEASALFDLAEKSKAITSGGLLRRTVLFWACLQGIMQLSKLRRLVPQAPTIRALADEASTTLLRGMGATEVDLRRAVRTADRMQKSST
ncbi:MAG: helix-turn-helix domain-containing protein [Deltaproteobacteria bacterium]|nr:helix-turn-helix domain-containing protein [Deltaproteobacteria bacterium]